MNLEKVSRTPVQVEKTDLSEIEAKKEIEVRRLTVASVRLDAVAGGVLHLSRGKVQALIAGEKANVNWNVTTNPSLLLKEGDMVSVRGFGRGSACFSIGGKNKKDRTGIEVGVYI